jgi:signal transduction histidine kinase
VVTFFDIGGQKRVEEELREAKRLAETANQAKGSFLATLSHEFRTPLNGILGYADLLAMGEPLTPDQALRVSRIQSGAWHLASMIDEILAFAKMEVGMESIRPARVDAGEVAREAMRLVEPMATAKALAFTLDPLDGAVEVVSDAIKLRQILVNLCGNAIRYTDHGEVRVRVRTEPGRTVFEVRDTGIGIAADDLPRVFDRFWQAESGVLRNSGGVGIGLAAAREFSRLLAGDVEVESTLGVGTAFRLWIPSAPPGHAGSPTPTVGGSTP